MKERDFRSPDISFRPEIRWWFAEGFHTDQTLKKDIQELYDNGFGAVELQGSIEGDRFFSHVLAPGKCL